MSQQILGERVIWISEIADVDAGDSIGGNSGHSVPIIREASRKVSMPLYVPALVVNLPNHTAVLASVNRVPRGKALAVKGPEHGEIPVGPQKGTQGDIISPAFRDAGLDMNHAC